MGDAMQVELAGQAVELRAPDRQAPAWDVLQARAQYGERAPMRVLSAALGVCTARDPERELQKRRYDILRYGGEVLEEWLSKGASYAAVVEAGGKALAILAETVVPADKVEEEARFFGPTEEGSTG